MICGGALKIYGGGVVVESPVMEAVLSSHYGTQEQEVGNNVMGGWSGEDGGDGWSREDDDDGGWSTEDDDDGGWSMKLKCQDDPHRRQELKRLLDLQRQELKHQVDPQQRQELINLNELK
ncbi:hypothetical protein ATANTOWER_025906 [Ataeniobius toweri]|uniref:Uncharacterized protein n=1 Tax=Ataeniobius toweri TaxID=208326 RepID=A0ABU7BLM9_9TELE|nr:hypothetical protein [Ataeniobius toweri]